MRVRHAAVLAALLFSGFGCGAQPPAEVTEPESKVSRNGCAVDPKQVCQIGLRMFDQREVALDNIGEPKPDTHSLDQERGPHRLKVLMDYRNPNGEPLALVNCEFDMRTRAITRADFKTPTKRDLDRSVYLRIQGLCL
jgi:hypothetical protein